MKSRELIGKSAIGAKAGAFALLAAMTAGSAFAAAAITIDKVQQRWPWNNKVDVTYTIVADNDDRRISRVELTAVINDVNYTVYDGAINADASAGTHTITWEDAPDGVQSDTCKMSASLESAIVPEGNDYMIVDLATGDVSYEGLCTSSEVVGGVSGQELSNVRYNVDKYKTTHLALRKIPAGTYQASESNTSTTLKDWTTDKDFYVAIFPWTNYQYLHVLDLDASGQNTAVRHALTYTGDIRGNSDPTVSPVARNTVHWPILEWLNYKTGLTFDLPTEVMHEIATRAGTTTTYFWGEDSSEATKYAICREVTRNYYYVGTRLPNAWGLYDMVGNDWEWCLDVLGGTRSVEDVFTPATGSNTSRIVRGQDCKTGGSNLTSLARSSANATSNTYSFRVAYVVPNSEE